MQKAPCANNFRAIEQAVRATAVGRNAERNAVLAGDPKGLDYYVILL